MYIAHVQTPWGESYFHVGDTPADLFSLLTEALGHEGMVGMFCTDENWEGAALVVGNIHHIGERSTAHWRTSEGGKVAICNYPDKSMPVDRIEALRGAIWIAEGNDRLLHGLDFSGMEMSEIRRDWKGFRFADCNLAGAEFTGCEMGNNEFIECNLIGCWMPVSESQNIRFTNNMYYA